MRMHARSRSLLTIIAAAALAACGAEGGGSGQGNQEAVSEQDPQTVVNDTTPARPGAAQQP
ncbi:MAG TPA: hypothetical protein VFQ45_23810 [Longimicrobium sp.]|nr:hypothetical protein [Longimicrobium sp.]